MQCRNAIDQRVTRSIGDDGDGVTKTATTLTFLIEIKSNHRMTRQMFASPYNNPFISKTMK